MHLAFWDFPPTECLELAARTLSIEAERQTGPVCAELLRQRQVDVALLPVTRALAAADELDIVPGGAVSSWGYPFARMRIRRDLQQAGTLGCTSEQGLEAFMSRVILKEHYGREVALTPNSTADIELLTGTASLNQADDPTTLDLGQEWYELSQYPMIWGLYVCLKGTATDAMVEMLTTLTKEAETIAQEWGARSSSHADQFFGGSLRLRLDDVTVAGLTVIREYMYYYGITEDLVPLTMFEPNDVSGHQEIPFWGQDTRQHGL